MSRRGFTLVELLTVLAVVAVLLGLLLSAVQKSRAAAARTGCLNNLRQVGLAMHNYHGTAGAFPPGYTTALPPKGGRLELGPGWGWAVELLPHLDQAPLAAALTRTAELGDPANAVAVQTRVPVLLCPADRPAPGLVAVGPRTHAGALRFAAAVLAPASYAGNFGVGEPGIDGDGVLFRNSRVRLADITDGASTTLLGGERAMPFCETVWAGVVPNADYFNPPGSPLPPQLDEAACYVLSHCGEMTDGAAIPGEVNSWSSNHSGGTTYLFCDGSVRLLTRATDYELLKAISTRAGGETLTKEPE